MEHSFFEKKETQKSLVIEYEALSQKENVLFFEEAAFWRIANYYFENAQWKAALGVVEHALRQHENASRFHILKAILFLELEKPDMCLQALCEIHKFLPDNDLPTIFRAEALCQAGHLTSTKNILIEMLNFSEQDETPDLRDWGKFLQHTLFFDGGQFDLLAEQAIRQPNNQALLEEIWMNVEMLENYRESIALHQTVLDRNAFSSRAWFNLAEAHLHLNELENAFEAYEYAFLTDAEFQEAYKKFIEVAMSLKKIRTAIVATEEMMGRFGEDSESLTMLGWCYFQLLDTSVAKYLFEKALKMDPYFVDAYYKMGLMYFQKSDFRTSVKWLQQGYNLENSREDVALALAESLKMLGKSEEALELYWRVVEIDPFEQKNWRKVIQFYTNARDFEESLGIIEQAFENCTDRNELNYIFSANLLLAGYRKKGLNALKKAIKIDPNSKCILFEIAPELSSDKKVLEIIRN